MTDKQIIIDDLDTRCPYHCGEKIGQCNNSSQETPHTYCIDNKDCIYKLYAHKEQECEKAKQKAQDTYELWQALIESFNILQGEKIKLEQECEELTSKCSQLEESFKETADGLLKIQYALADHCNKYSKTLTETKEIITTALEQNTLINLDKILQKISECEVG